MNLYLGIVFGLFNAILTALGKVYLSKSMKEFPSSVSFFIETMFGLLLWIPFSLIIGLNLNAVIEIVPYVIISAIFAEAYIFYIYSKGDINIIASIFATYSVYTIIFSWLLLGERLSITPLFFITLTVLGTLIIAYDTKLKFSGKSIKPVLWGLSGAVVAGFSDAISKKAIDDSSAGDFLFTLALVQVPISVAYLKLEKLTPKLLLSLKSELNRYKYSILAALVIAISMIFFWLSFEFSFASIASPITSTNVMFIIIFSHFMLKTQITKKNMLGVILILVGIIGLNLTI